MNLTQTRLDNGLRVILRERHSAPVCSLQLFYRVGSRNEIPGGTGLSHWVEHMVFKGTEQFPAGEYDRQVARCGGFMNAMTAQDWTVYYLTLPSDRFDLALRIERDRMANARFDPHETESERTVILSEREGSENNSMWRLFEEVTATAYHAHSYRHPVIGWRPDLLLIDRDQLYQHYRRHYAPQNATLVAVGDFASSPMLDQIHGHFGDLAQGAPIAAPTVRETPQDAERSVRLRGPDPASYLIMGYHAVAADHEHFFPLMVLDAILSGAKSPGLSGGGGGNRSSRLYRALVESGLAVSADSNFQPSIDPQLFSFYVTLAPDTAHEQAQAMIQRELEVIARDGVHGDELAKTLKQVRAQFAYGSESVTDQAYWLGFSETVADLEWLAGWQDAVAAVTSEDVQTVAAGYFAGSNRTVGYYIPDPAPQEAAQ